MLSAFVILLSSHHFEAIKIYVFNFASIKIHMERAKSLVRNKYSILQSTLILDYLIKRDKNFCTIDKMASVCAALCNLCPSVIPFE